MLAGPSGTHSVVRLAVVPLSGGTRRTPEAFSTVNIRRKFEKCTARSAKRTKLLTNERRSAENGRTGPEDV